MSEIPPLSVEKANLGSCLSQSCKFETSAYQVSLWFIVNKLMDGWMDESTSSPTACALLAPQTLNIQWAFTTRPTKLLCTREGKMDRHPNQGAVRTL